MISEYLRVRVSVCVRETSGALNTSKMAFPKLTDRSGFKQDSLHIHTQTLVQIYTRIKIFTLDKKQTLGNHVWNDPAVRSPLVGTNR